MGTFRVWGNVSVSVSIEVEADNAEHAKEIADEQWCGLSGYCGNGGTNKLVGTSESGETVEPNDDAPDWSYTEEINS